MKIYTKTGDKGQTALFGGKRVSKSHIRVQAYGELDQLNSQIGFILPSLIVDARNENSVIIQSLQEIMSDLFDMGAELATENTDKEKLEKKLDTMVSNARIEELETLIDKAQSELSPLKTFILPSGSEASCRFHLARVAVRKSERTLVSLAAEGIEVRAEIIAYLNRLSDLFFVWARLMNHREQLADLQWIGLKMRSISSPKHVS